MATHEIGHAHGLSHVLNNQKSGTDGTGATMFPFIDTGDPASELSQRTLDSDDIAWSSYFYPEGSATSGPAALQPGDVPFKAVYGLITGTVTHGVLNQPLAGASVSATDLVTGSEFTSGFSGTTQVSFDPATGNIFVVSPDHDILDGKYVLPVKLGVWKVGVEAVDGEPVPSGRINSTTLIGESWGQQNFNEGLWGGPFESAHEVNAGFAFPVVSLPSFTIGNVNVVTNDQINIDNFGSATSSASPARRRASTTRCRFPPARSRRVNPGGDLLIQAASVRHVRARRLGRPRVRGGDAHHRHGQRLDGDARPRPSPGSPDRLRRPGRRLRAVLFPLPRPAGQAGANQKIAHGDIQNLFLVLRLSTSPPSGRLGGAAPDRRSTAATPPTTCRSTASPSPRRTA